MATALLAPSGTAVVVVPSTPVVRSAAGTWEAQQIDRTSFDPMRTYRVNIPVSLFWFDPTTGQTLEVGRLIGEFRVVAEFGLKQQAQTKAYAVPYRINQDYGLTSISPAIIERMRVAGYSDTVEVYVLAQDTMTFITAAIELPFSELASRRTLLPH